MNLSTIIISTVLLIVVVLIIRSMYKQKKSGQCVGCSGCGGSVCSHNLNKE